MKLWISCTAALLFIGCKEPAHDLKATILRIDMDLPDEQGVLRKIHHEARVIHDSVWTYYQIPKMHTTRRGDSSVVDPRYDDGNWFVHRRGNDWVSSWPEGYKFSLDSFLLRSGFSFRLDPSSKEQLMSRSRRGDSLLLTYRNLTLCTDTDPNESVYYFLPQNPGWHFSLSPSMDSLGLGRLVRMRMIYRRPAREYVFSIGDTMISRKALVVGLASH